VLFADHHSRGGEQHFPGGRVESPFMVKNPARLALSVAGKVIFVVAALYLGCYHLRSAILMEGRVKTRVYGTAVEARLFEPLAKVESLLSGRRVVAHHPEK
jgi:hypothetical protein